MCINGVQLQQLNGLEFNNKKLIMKKIFLGILVLCSLISKAQNAGEISAVIAAAQYDTTTATTNITAVNGTGALVNVNGRGMVMFSLAGTWVANVQVQYSFDNAATWTSVVTSNSVFSAVNNSAVANGSINNTGATAGYYIPTNNANNVRLFCNSFTSGTITVFAKASRGTNVVVISGVLTVTVSGTVALGAGAAAIGTVGVTSFTGGQTANSAASTGNPLRSGGRVVQTTAATQDQTFVAGDAGELPLTTGSQVIVKPYGTAENDWQFASATAGIVNTTTAVTFKAASGTAGIRNYITAIQINTEAVGAATELAIRDGAAGPVIWRIKIPAAGIPNFPLTFPTPLKSTANTLLEVVTLTASVTGAVYFNAQGYTGF
jgi:hypothetical protein